MAGAEADAAADGPRVAGEPALRAFAADWAAGAGAAEAGCVPPHPPLPSPGPAPRPALPRLPPRRAVGRRPRLRVAGAAGLGAGRCIPIA